MTQYTESKSYSLGFPGRIRFLEGDVLSLKDGNTFLVDSEIGEGGFGTVYKVVNSADQRPYALKLLEFFKMKPSETQQILSRFYEGYKAGLIPSQHLVHNLGSGFFDNNPYVLMDYCPNGNLAKNKTKYRTESQVLGLAADLCAGLKDLHQNGYVHRDFKPENVLFDGSMTAKLCDFDISGRYGLHDKRVTVVNRSGEVLEVWGTLAYSAPEQMDHKEAYRYLGPQMDIFSLGVTLYELLTNGNLPFGTAQEIKEAPLKYTKRVKTKNFKPISEWRNDLSPKWIRFFEQCLEPNPTKRAKDISQIMEILGIYEPIIRNLNLNAQCKNTLVVRAGDDIGKKFDLKILFEKADKDILKFGREDEDNPNDISLKESMTSYISRKHGTLEKNDDSILLRDGQWSLDSKPPAWNYSLNGIFVNGELLDRNRSHILKPGDVITIGEVILQYL
jgi:serine/threonine protein kinase